MLVKVEVHNRIAVVISEIIGRSGRHFLANFLWWHIQQTVWGLCCRQLHTIPIPHGLDL